MLRYKITGLLIYFLGVVHVKSKCGEIHYSVEFLGAFESCPEFENKAVDFSKVTIHATKDASYLNGSMEFNEELKPGIQILIEVYKEEGATREPFNMVEGDLCRHIQDQSAPWYPLMAAMNITECPIKDKIYVLRNLKMDLDKMEKFITHDFLGVYCAEMMFMKPTTDTGLVDVPGETISCHSITVSLKESMDANC